MVPRIEPDQRRYRAEHDHAGEVVGGRRRGRHQREGGAHDHADDRGDADTQVNSYVHRVKVTRRGLR